MVNLKSKKCFEQGCKVIPSYNYKNEKEALFCSKHKKEEMVNLKNFKSIKCLDLGCDIIPSYNYINEKEGLYCSKHKKEGMINLIKKTVKYDRRLVNKILE